MRAGYTITIPSLTKKPGEETATGLRRIRSAEKIMMVIFWDKYGILLSEYLSRATTIRGSYYALIIERLCCTIREKRSSKVSDGVLPHDNGPCNGPCSQVQYCLECYSKDWFGRIESSCLFSRYCTL